MKMLLFSGGRSSDEGGDDDHSEGVGNKGEVVIISHHFTSFVNDGGKMDELMTFLHQSLVSCLIDGDTQHLEDHT